MTTFNIVDDLTNKAIAALGKADRTTHNTYGNHTAEHHREVAAVFAELAKANAIALAGRISN